MYLWFFFSSRRRHTRWTGDWSSDVCSSDLIRSSGPDSRSPRRVKRLPSPRRDRTKKIERPSREKRGDSSEECGGGDVSRLREPFVPTRQSSHFVAEKL